MIDERTIAELEAESFTHLDAACAGCGAIVQDPFHLMRTRKKITDETTVAELRRRYVCKRCGGHSVSRFQPWKQ